MKMESLKSCRLGLLKRENVVILLRRPFKLIMKKKKVLGDWGVTSLKWKENRNGCTSTKE